MPVHRVCCLQGSLLLYSACQIGFSGRPDRQTNNDSRLSPLSRERFLASNSSTPRRGDAAQAQQARGPLLRGPQRGIDVPTRRTHHAPVLVLVVLYPRERVLRCETPAVRRIPGLFAATSAVVAGRQSDTRTAARRLRHRAHRCPRCPRRGPQPRSASEWTVAGSVCVRGR